MIFIVEICLPKCIYLLKVVQNELLLKNKLESQL